MVNSTYTRFTAWVSVLLILFSSMGPSFVAAQSVDVEAPVIEHTVLTNAIAGASQEFVAIVTDNQQVGEVVFFHRLEGDREYTEQQMSLRETGEYYTSIDTDPRSVLSIEYYIRATDRAGTSTLRGFMFQPLVRTIVNEAVIDSTLTNSTGQSPTLAASVEDVESAAPEPKKRRTWLYLLGGALVVGALLGASGSDEPNDTTVEDCSTSSCPVTFVLNPPQ